MPETRVDPRRARTIARTALALAVGASLAGPASLGYAGPNPYDSIGLASWYGARYHGRITANGERYDMGAMTAAHRTLPFGSLVEVTNLNNGRSVTLRINDRGPYAGKRIIDVSRSAAEELGFLDAGLTQVRVQLVGRTRPRFRE